jgi:hypothetical protein
MSEGTALLVWCAIGLAVTYLSFSTVMVITRRGEPGSAATSCSGRASCAGGRASPSPA